MERREHPAAAVHGPNAADDLLALAATIWGEARGEPELGQIAVGWVVRNRAADPGWWGDGVLAVCLAPRQFTCWWDDQAERVSMVDEDDPRFRRCLAIAARLINPQDMPGSIADPTHGADHYHARGVTPAWADGRRPTARIGRHIFYRLGKNGDDAA